MASTPSTDTSGSDPWSTQCLKASPAGPRSRTRTRSRYLAPSAGPVFASQALTPRHPEFAEIRFAPHDFWKLFATDLVNNGLPIHIGAALLGHLNVQTTWGYVAVFEEDIVDHYQDFLDRRRTQRPDGEYRQPGSEEWADFQDHFDKRKVELGSCGRPYGTACPHEHACFTELILVSVR